MKNMVSYNPLDLRKLEELNNFQADVYDKLQALYPKSRGTNVLPLIKGVERYIFIYDNESVPETLRTLGRFAADIELSFTWYDAAVLSQSVREKGEETNLKKRLSKLI